MSDSTRDIFLALSVCSTVDKNKAAPTQLPDASDNELGNSPALAMGNLLKNCIGPDSLKHIPQG